MLTRSHARTLARREAAARAAVLVSLSATGKGTHMRWTNPEDENGQHSKHPIIRIRTRTCYKTDQTATCSTGSSSSISGSEESSSEDIPVVTPTSSFDTCASLPITPQRNNKPLTTPPRLSPKKLQRSPRGRWITANGTTGLVFIEDQADFRELQDEIKSQRIKERELETLLRERDVVNGEKDEDFVMDVVTQTSGTWRDQVSSTETSEVNNFGDMELPEARKIALMSGGPRQVRFLDTKMDEPVTFMHHSMDSCVETWRQGVL